MDKSLIVPMVVDTITSVAGGAILTMCIILRSVGFSHQLLCDAYFLSFHTPLFIGVVSTALVAVIRFKSIQRSESHSSCSIINLS